MEKKITQFLKGNKTFLVFYLIWFLTNLTLLNISGDNFLGRRYGITIYSTDFFWPFQGRRWGIRAYDHTEFIFYLIVPLVLFGIWKLIGEDVKKFFYTHVKNIKFKRKKKAQVRQVNKTYKKSVIPVQKIKKSGVIVLLIITIIVWLLFYLMLITDQIYGTLPTADTIKGGAPILFFFRLITVPVLVVKAQEIKENTWIWGTFGFFVTPIALLVMVFKINKCNRIKKKTALR